MVEQRSRAHAMLPNATAPQSVVLEPHSETHATPPVPSRWLYVVVAILLLGLVIGAGGAWLVLRPPVETSNVVTFARDMSAHHNQAVEMAQLIRDRSSDPELRQFALDIVLTQQAQIGQMQGWLGTWGVPLNGVTPPMQGMGTMMGMATPEQVAELSTLPVDQAEVSFLQLMIRHHQGGVIMAKPVAEQQQRAEVTRLARAIIIGQQSEIAYMRELLAKRGAAPLPDLEPMHM